MPPRIAGVCGIAAAFTFVIGMTAGGIAQRDPYSAADDSVSDLGALTADSAWLYNQVAANLSGLLLIGLALGLWTALGASVLGRVGAAALAVAGAGAFLDGIFRLDCRGIDRGCTNDSWHADAHGIESGVTGAATLLAPILLAFAFRRIPRWRDTWIPTLLAVPASLVAGVAFSVLGDGAAQRATTVAIFAWIAFVALRLIQKSAPASAVPRG